MKLPNTDRGWPAGEVTEDWTSEQLIALLRHQYTVLTARDGKIRKAVEATDEDIQEIAATIVELEEQIAVAKSNPSLAADFDSRSPGEKLAMQRAWLDDLSADDFSKARILGCSEADINKFRADLDKWEIEVKEWQRRQSANKILGIGLKQEDNFAGDEYLKFLDKYGRKSLFMPPKDILKKKGN